MNTSAKPHPSNIVLSYRSVVLIIQILFKGIHIWLYDAFLSIHVLIKYNDSEVLYTFASNVDRSVSNEYEYTMYMCIVITIRWILWRARLYVVTIDK